MRHDVVIGGTFSGLAIVSMTLVLFQGGVGLLHGAQSGDVLTYHNDNARTGQNLHEEILTPANVNS